eukprot:945242-Pleurochrysis_carterae.AAC.1
MNLGQFCRRFQRLKHDAIVDELRGSVPVEVAQQGCAQNRRRDQHCRLRTQRMFCVLPFVKARNAA